ncbi:MAG: hypothetical protein KDC92_18200, partial [Bacteroidetes bacterium]|nr:hypothetical protein [Bacteroidota bacterium]
LFPVCVCRSACAARFVWGNIPRESPQRKFDEQQMVDSKKQVPNKLQNPKPKILKPFSVASVISVVKAVNPQSEIRNPQWI